MQERIVVRFSILMSPVYFLLFMKVISGINMFCRRMTKGAFLKYYVISWSFYWSLTTQMTFILIASWASLRTLVQWLWVIGLFMTIPAWIIMNMHNSMI